jgi:hypothetical protein
LYTTLVPVIGTLLSVYPSIAFASNLWVKRLFTLGSAHVNVRGPLGFSCTQMIHPPSAYLSNGQLPRSVFLGEFVVELSGGESDAIRLGRVGD